MALDAGGAMQRALFEQILREAQKRWTGIYCEADDFSRHVEHLGVNANDLVKFGPELFLAWACCHYDACALRVLDSEYIAHLPRKAVSSPAGSDFADEVIQELRHKLLLPPEPRLSQYTARGPLMRWMRVVASRIAIDLRRGIRCDAMTGRSFAVFQQSSVDSLEVQRYALIIRATIRQAFLRLRSDERDLLRRYHLDGFSLDRLAALNGVHRATVARWLSELRHRVLATTEAEVVASHRLTKSEFHSVIHGAAAHVDTDGLWSEMAESVDNLKRPDCEEVPWMVAIGDHQ